jgi:hypothetical protein
MMTILILLCTACGERGFFGLGSEIVGNTIGKGGLVIATQGGDFDAAIQEIIVAHFMEETGFDVKIEAAYASMTSPGWC